MARRHILFHALWTWFGNDFFFKGLGALEHDKSLGRSYVRRGEHIAVPRGHPVGFVARCDNLMPYNVKYAALFSAYNQV